MDTTKQVVGGKMTIREGIKDYKISTAYRQGELEFERENPEMAKSLAKGDYDKEGYELAIETRNTYLDRNMKEIAGIERKEGKVRMYEKEDGLQGQRDIKSGDIYINARNTNMGDVKEVTEVIGHELGHGYGAKTEKEAQGYSEKMLRAIESESRYNGYQFSEGGNSRNWLDKNRGKLEEGNRLVSQVEARDEKIAIINEGKEWMRVNWMKDKDYKIDVTKVGNFVQKVPAPVLDVAAITVAPIALSAGLLGAPFVEGAIVWYGVGTTLTSIGKTVFDYKEDEISKKQAIINTGLNTGSLLIGKIFPTKFLQYNASKSIFIAQKITENNVKKSDISKK